MVFCQDLFWILRMNAIYICIPYQRKRKRPGFLKTQSTLKYGIVKTIMSLPHCLTARLIKIYSNRNYFSYYLNYRAFSKSRAPGDPAFCEEVKVTIMKKIPFLFVLFLLSISVVTVSADFYRFVDENGNVIYTDDINKVPVEQREAVQSYEESASEQAKPADSGDTPEDAAGNKIDITDEDLKERERLQAQEKELSREYEELMTQREQLNEVKKNAISAEQINEYNQKIIEFNARIQAYEEKRGALETEVKAFNEHLKARQKETP